MKRLFLIAALMCYLVSASAQPIRKESKPRSWEESLLLVEKMNGRENVFTMKLDSVTMYQGDNMKVLFDYDAHFNCTWLAVYYLDDEWEMGFAFEYAYDEQDRLTTFIDYEDERKVEYVYNAQSLVGEIYRSRDQYDGTWEMYEKQVLTYDAESHLVLSLVYDMENGNWVESAKQTWDYEDGLLQAYTFYYHNEGEWMPARKTEYTYNTEGLCIEETESLWTSQEFWRPDGRIVYHYEAQQCYEEIEYGWNGEEWSEQYKHSYEHDASGNLLTEITYYHQPGEQDWTYRNKYEYLYDDDNNCTDYYEYYHYFGEDDWDLETVFHTTYGTPGIESISGLSLMWDLFEFPFPVSHKVEQLIMDDDGDYYYLDFHYSSMDGIDEQTAGVLGVYPNPTDGILNVWLPNSPAPFGRGTCDSPAGYRISNLMGQTVQSGVLNAGTQEVNLSALPRGVYLITIGSTTRKIVVE